MFSGRSRKPYVFPADKPASTPVAMWLCSSSTRRAPCLTRCAQAVDMAPSINAITLQSQRMNSGHWKLQFEYVLPFRHRCISWPKVHKVWTTIYLWLFKALFTRMTPVERDILPSPTMTRLCYLDGGLHSIGDINWNHLMTSHVWYISQYHDSMYILFIMDVPTILTRMKGQGGNVTKILIRPSKSAGR